MERKWKWEIIIYSVFIKKKKNNIFNNVSKGQLLISNYRAILKIIKIH